MNLNSTMLLKHGISIRFQADREHIQTFKDRDSDSDSDSDSDREGPDLFSYYITNCGKSNYNCNSNAWSSSIVIDIA